MKQRLIVRVVIVQNIIQYIVPYIDNTVLWEYSIFKGE